jgi:hypothetical protein
VDCFDKDGARVQALEFAMTEPDKTERDKPEEEEGIVLTEEQLRARRNRSIAIALALLAMVILFFIMTLVKGPHMSPQPI